MQRVPCAPRPDWLATVQSQGLTFAVDRTATTPGLPYWNEQAHYDFTTPEIDHLEAVTEQLHALVIEAVGHVLDDAALLSRFNLPEGAADLLRRSFAERDDREWSLYGRFDLAWGGLGTGDPKLLEYNADTPTALVEASVIQWMWLEDVFPQHDQWNMLHERLIQSWQRLRARDNVARIHLAAGAQEPEEDWATLAYLADTVAEAGLTPVVLSMEEIGWDRARAGFVDLAEQPIFHCYKLFPTEWLLGAEFGRHLLNGTTGTRWIEPPWKLVAASKLILPVLWDLFPGHPNLLPAHFDTPGELREYVVKPVYGWEGDGIRIVSDAGMDARPSTHTAGQPVIYQQYTPLPNLNGNRPVLGCWMIGGHAAGLGMRESDNLITDTRSRFVPHRILSPRSTPEQVAQWLTDD